LKKQKLEASESRAYIQLLEEVIYKPEKLEAADARSTL
jgi:hypothetical protein